MLSRIEVLLRYAVIGSAAVLSWLLLNTSGLTEENLDCLKVAAPYLLLTWLIPPLAVLMCGALTLISYVRIIQIGAYLKQLENSLGNASLGWEKHLQPKFALLTVTTALAWATVFGATVYATHVGLDRFSSTTPACKSGVK